MAYQILLGQEAVISDPLADIDLGLVFNPSLTQLSTPGPAQTLPGTSSMLSCTTSYQSFSNLTIWTWFFLRKAIQSFSLRLSKVDAFTRPLKHSELIMK